jgi:hypothetical protein
MRVLFFAALLALSACGQNSTQQGAQTGCEVTATHALRWTNAETPDLVTATSEGASCAQAVVTLVGRSPDGDPLWAFSSTYYDMTAGGPPPEDAPPATEEDVRSFLESWANVTTMQSSTLPEWRDDAATLTESATTFSYDTPLPREAYEMLRQRALPMVCFAIAAEGAQCLIIDPATGSPAPMVAYGP